MPVPLRVLMLDDSAADAELMLRELRAAGFEPEGQRAHSEQELRAALSGELEVILADNVLSGFDALQALRHVRERGLDVPFIIVSSEAGEELAVAAMAEGIDDYVWKDRLSRLRMAVTNALERKRLRDSERKQGAQLHLQAAAMEAAANSIIITDIRGQIIWVNPAFTAVTGYSPEEAIGRSPSLLKSGKHDNRFYQKLWNTILSGECWHGEIINRRKDGSLYHEETTITPVRTQGKITHFIAVKQDVTGRKELEARFLQAQKMESFGRLAGGVAHDFNNLLTVIGGCSDIILAGSGGMRSRPELAGACSDASCRESMAPNSMTAEGGMRSRPELAGACSDASCRASMAHVHELVNEIKRASDRAGSLTQQLLAFSRKQVLQPKVLDLNALLADLQKMLRRVIGEDIELIVRPAIDMRRVKADPTQIQQVLLNLAVNARDAMPGGGKLTISTRRVGPGESCGTATLTPIDGGYIELDVSDTGCGMPPDVLAHAFEPFFTTKEAGKGTGLGLATVHGIIAQSGGCIDVQSEAGQGTTFRIFLPTTEGSLSGLRPMHKVGPFARPGEAVLLVEDDPAVRTLAAFVLRQAGYAVIEGSRGQEALDLLSRPHRPIQLMLTDVVMPEMSGRKLAELLRQESPDTRVLYMSGYLDDTIVRHGILERGLAFLQKPFTPTTLLEKVREVLDGGRGA